MLIGAALVVEVFRYHNMYITFVARVANTTAMIKRYHGLKRSSSTG